MLSNFALSFNLLMTNFKSDGHLLFIPNVKLGILYDRTISPESHLGHFSPITEFLSDTLQYFSNT